MPNIGCTRRASPCIYGGAGRYGKASTGFWRGVWRVACLMLFTSCLLDVLGDFFNKEGLILNICFVLFPLILPGYVLYAYSLSLWWGVLAFPAGLIAGLIFYAILDSE